jgi:hypothetical protein
MVPFELRLPVLSPSSNDESIAGRSSVKTPRPLFDTRRVSLSKSRSRPLAWGSAREISLRIPLTTWSRLSEWLFIISSFQMGVDSKPQIILQLL